MDDGERPRRGIGFFPEAVVIRSGPSRPVPKQRHADDDEYAKPKPLTYQGPDSWTLWKDWHINPSGHGDKERRAPPKFVLAKGTYDELGRGIRDGTAVDVTVVEEEEHDASKLKGGDVADWYRSLASRSGTATPKESERQASTSVPAPVEASVGTPAPQPVRVHRSEWFIRRALLTSSQAAAVPPKAPTRPSSIGSMLNISTAKPPPPPPVSYTLGPDNAGYARLEALGWAGGGLGRPEGWSGDSSEPSPRPSRGSTPKRQIEVDGVVDLTADSDDSDGSASEEGTDRQHGPGRVLPVATALKLDRLGIGRARTVDKKVTHSAAEITAAQRRAKGVRGPPPTGEPSKKAKVKWAERDRRERESRRRLAAALNS